MPRRRTTYSSHPNHRARMAHAQGDKQFRSYDTSHIRPRQSKAPLVVGIVLAVIVLIVAAVLISSVLKSCSTTESVDGSQVVIESTMQVTIPSDSSASEVADVLEAASAVPDADDFLARATELGYESQLQAGTYTFTEGMTLDEVITAVATGDTGGTSLTIPEGYTIEDIAEAVEEVTEGAITADEFVEAASDASVYADDYDFLADAGTASLEGFLFPKTYSVTETDTADSIIRKMLTQFSNEIASLDWSYPESQGLSVYEAVTLASIVEKESSGDEDIRAQVAAVFYNRLSEDNTETYGYLQSDATTAYEVGHDPSSEEVQSDSEYSTYTNAGLPPTPICSPGLDCLEAVCSPASDYEDYYYFIFWTNDDGDTEYYFSKTYAEHLAAIEEYLS